MWDWRWAAPLRCAARAPMCPCQREAGGGAAGATAAEHVHTFLLFHVSLS